DRGDRAGPERGLAGDGEPPLRRDRGHHDRRPRRRDGHGPDQERRSVPVGASREVQPAPADRGRARRCRGLPGSIGPRGVAVTRAPWVATPVSGGAPVAPRRSLTLVDRRALPAAFVGIGMAVTIGISFLLVIPIEPVYWVLAIAAGLLGG